LSRLYLLSSSDPTYWEDALTGDGLMAAEPYLPQYRLFGTFENTKDYVRHFSNRGYKVIAMISS
jgi:hypothetical protein